jgi:RNA polymerase sigma-70 factor (ECF subfamily)
MTTTSDAELLQASKRDAAAFREVYDRHSRRIFGFHLRRTGNTDAAHDLTAETFAQAWFSRSRFRDQAGGSAGPWLAAIARHVLSASVRKKALEQTACERLGVRERLDRPQVDVRPDETWLDDTVDDALADLPDGQRDAILLHVVDDLAYADVGRVLGTTPEAARVRVHRGLETLRQRLHDRREERS